MSTSSIRVIPRRLSVALLVWASIWFVSLMTPPSAYAHATLLRSDPLANASFTRGPVEITLWFSEAIELEYSQIVVLRRDGVQLVTGDLSTVNSIVDPHLRLDLGEPYPEGSYTVVWSTLSSVDGHIVEGYFSFTVGDAILPGAEEEAELAASVKTDKVVPLPVEAGVRWLNLLGQAVIAGVLLFIPFVLMPVLRDGEGRAIPIPSRRFRLLLFGGLAATVVGHAASAVIQIMNATRSTELFVLGDPLYSLLTGTRYGALWLSRTVLIVALAVLLWMLTRRKRLMSLAGQGRTFWIWAGWIAALVLLTTSLGSHAAARGGAQSLPVAFDWIHLVGTGVWSGGLLAMALSLPLATAAGPDVRLQLIRRFSIVALIAFVALAITGTVAAVREVDSLDGLTATRYGLWFTLKLAAVAGAVGFGAWHWLVVRPALESRNAPVISRAATGLRRTLRLELSMVILAIAATGVLTSTIPARDLLSGGLEAFPLTHLTSDASITLRAAPGKVGDNDFSVAVGPVDADQFGAVRGITLQIVQLGLPAAETTTVDLQQASPNDPWTWQVAGDYVSSAGDWALTAIIEREQGPDVETTFEVTAANSGFRPLGVPAPASDNARTTEMLVLGGVWLLGALTLATSAWYMNRRERAVASFGLLTLSVLAAAMGSVLMIMS